jgi:hypothetical protein
LASRSPASHGGGVHPMPTPHAVYPARPPSSCASTSVRARTEEGQFRKRPCARPEGAILNVQKHGLVYLTKSKTES